MRRRGILLTVWLAGTVFATFLAWSAVSLVGATVTETQAASTDLVVAGRPAATSADSGPGTTTTLAPAVTGVSEGGQATWTCDGDTPTLVDASPHIGWERDTRAPDGEVWFDHDGDDSAIAAECDDGLPVVEIHEEEYDEEVDDEDVVTTTAPPATAATVAPPATDDDDGGGDEPGDDNGGDDSDSSGSGSDHDEPDEPDEPDPDKADEPDEDKPEDD